MCDISVGMTDNKDKNKAEILLLSIAANIVSRHTSMVGVDKDRKEKIVGEMIQRDVPLMRQMYGRQHLSMMRNSAMSCSAASADMMMSKKVKVKVKPGT